MCEPRDRGDYDRATTAGRVEGVGQFRQVRRNINKYLYSALFAPSRRLARLAPNLGRLDWHDRAATCQ